ncbi:MAG TPA: MFS transporter [Gammaproteobacteria bacterium]
MSTGTRLSAANLVLTGICALIYLLDGLIHSILGPLAPDMGRSLSLGNAELGPIFSANLLGQCIGLVVFPLFGRIGQRAIVLVSLVGFGLGQAASALADGATELIAWRLVTGLFLGGCLPSCLAIVTAVAPAARRGLAIMILFTGYGLGATLAGIVAAAFADAGGWRGAMVGVGVACLVTALIAWRWLDVPPARTAADDASSRKEGALGIVNARYLLGTLMLWLMFVSMLTISYCLNSWLPTLLVQVGRDEAFAALSVSVFSFGGIVAALGVGLLIDRFGAMRTLISFTVLSAVTLFAVGQLLGSASASLLMALLGACGFFVLGAYGGVNVVLASFYPDDLRAHGIGWAKSVGRLGTVIAPVLIGWGLDVGITQASIMSLFAVPALVAAASLVVIALAAAGRQRAVAEPAATMR